MNLELPNSGLSSRRMGQCAADENPYAPTGGFSGWQDNFMQVNAGSRFSFFMTFLFAVLMIFGLDNHVNAQAVSFSGTPYTQDFQTLTASDLNPVNLSLSNMYQVSDQNGGGSGNSGWYFYYTAGTARWGRSAGTSTTGSVFGMWNAAGEKAIGSQGSASAVAYFGVVLQNNSGSTITSLNLSYDAVMVRNPSTTVNPYPMSYLVSSTANIASGSGAGTFNDGAGSWVSGTGFNTPSTGTGAPSSTQLTYSPFVKIGGAAITQTLTLNWTPGTYLYIRWKETDDSGADSTAGIDNFSLSLPAMTPLISASAATTPTSVSTTYGTASSNATFTVSGTNMSAGILVTPPNANFEVSTSPGGPFTNALTVGASGTIANTTVYIRLKASAPFGSYSGNIALSSTSATTVNVPIQSSSVSRKTLTYTGGSAPNKVYDRTTTSSITGGSLSGIESGDTVSVLSNAANFSNASAGLGKDVTGALTLTGASANNYTLTQPVRQADITPKALTITGASANSKVYDGGTAAAISGTLSGVINPDNVTLSLSGNFISPYVDTLGNPIAVNSTSTLGGTDATNYSLTQPSGLSAIITPKPLTLDNADALDKLFDGNTDAVVTGDLSGIIGFDEVFLVGTGTFQNTGPGVNIPVTSTSTLDGLDSFNYSLVQPTGLAATIFADEPDPQTITFSPLADVTYGDAAFNLSATASSGLTVTYESSNTSVATVTGNIVTIVGAGSTVITAMQGGDANYSEAPEVEQALSVLPKALTLSATADNKFYDVTDAATISALLTGIVGDDDVVFIGTGTFDSVDVANGIAVSSTSTLGGTDAANYTFSQPVGLTANITPLALTVINATALSKIYDGNTNATITGATLAGILGGDIVTVSGGGSFVSKNVANNVAVIPALALSGADAGNYTVTQPAGLSANITAATLSIGGLTGNNKIYDRLTDATVSGTPLLSGIIGTDIVSVSGAPTANFNNKNIGSGKPITVSGYTLSGADAGNYNVLQPTGLTGDITAASLTISGAQAQDKGYDGTTAAVITGTLSGVITPDAVTLIGTGFFASSAVGNNIAVTSTSTLGGADAGNYIINPQPTGLTADILPAPSFTQGRLVVARIGAIGGGTLNNAATATFLDEYTTAGVAGISVALPTTTTAGSLNRITESGSATSEGQLSRSADNRYLVIGGYDAAPGLSGVNSAAVNRVIARVDKQGVVATSLFTNATHGSGFRSVATVDGTRYWTGGNGVGVTTLAHQGNTTAVTTTTVSSTVTNLRTVSIQNNQLYVSTGSGTTGVYKVGNGVPSTSGQTAVIAMAATGPYAHYLVNRGGNNWNCYIANDSGGIAKFSSTDNGSNWTSRGTVSTPAAALGIVGQVNANNVDVYVSANAAIYKLTDTAAFNANISGTATTLVTAATNTVFRGIAFAPFEAEGPTASVIAGTATICSGASTNLSVAVTGGTAPFTVVYTDGTSNFTVNNYASGANIPVSPTANTTYTLVSVTDANGLTGTGNSGSATITVLTPTTYYADNDNDGFGNAASTIASCTGAPAGYVSDNTDCNDAVVYYQDNDGDGFGSTVKVACGTVTNSSDCDDNQIRYADGDGDGFGSGILVACGGVTNNTDCNDSNPSIFQLLSLYVDADGDGYGTGTSTTPVCSGNSIPVGYASLNGDCDDTKSTVHPGAVEIGYNLIDDDCDGLIDEGFPPKNTTIMTEQCNTTLPAIDSQLIANLVAGAQGYQWRITTVTGPNAGQIQFLNTPLRVMKLTQLATYAYNTTYQVEVAVYYAGYLQPYLASNCTITTPMALTNLVSCPQTSILTLADVVYANNVQYATGYRFRITDPMSPANTQTLDRAVREFRMSQITAFQVQFNKIYNVEVAVRNIDGNYMPFNSTVCTVRTPVFPTTSLVQTQCDDYSVPTNNTLIYADSYPGAIAYVFNLTGNGLPAQGIEITRATRAFKLSDFPGLIPGATYNVRVRLIFNAADAPGLYGKVCTITTPGALRISKVPFDAVAYPNPFTDGFGIEVTTSGKATVSVRVYDMTGRLLDDASQGSGTFLLGENYPSGVYNVIVSQADETKTLRVVKR